MPRPGGVPDPAALAAIGRLRVEVWRDEGVLAQELSDQGRWLDPFDAGCRHWIVRDPADPELLLACARLSFHDALLGSPDGPVWRDHGREVPVPVGNLAKLVVRRDARRQGLASGLNEVRIAAARAMGLQTLTVTASDANARLLFAQGFRDLGWTVCFANRPGFPFRALELVLSCAK